MTSASDRYNYEKAIEEDDNVVYFSGKRWTYTRDKGSVNGVFSSEMSFDFDGFYNLNQWNEPAEIIVQFPIFMGLYADKTLTAATNADTLTACIKSSFYQMVDTISIDLGGTTIKSPKMFNNVETTFEILSTWSADEYNKNAATVGLALDRLDISNSLDNQTVTNAIPAHKGFVLNYTDNIGYIERCGTLNSNVAATSLSKAILANPEKLGKSQVFVDKSATLAAGNYTFAAAIMGTIRIKDSAPVVGKLPFIKGLKGNITIGYNSCEYKFTTDASNGAYKSTVSYKTPNGHTAPAMLNEGFTGGHAESDPTWTFTCDVSGVIPASLSGSGLKFPHSEARLYMPALVANPETDKSLTIKKKIRYLETDTTTFTIAAGSTFSATLNPGVVNPKRLILLPLLTGADSTTDGLTALKSRPEENVYSHEPAGSSPFAALTDIQCNVAGVPCFASPIKMDWEMFVQEFAQQGVDGGMNVMEASGLLNKTLWNSLYRYYTIDLSRRIPSDDGASKSIFLECANATNAPMKVISITQFEREIEVDSLMGTIKKSI